MSDSPVRPERENSPLNLRPKARLLKTLGEELISSETVAIIELVKNAYDADARNVLVKFEGPLIKDSGTIAIYDDGHGMDMNVIQDSWMVVATSTKKNETTSKSGNRRVLGEKGIGRFATSRLANELELITRVDGSPIETYTYFDWTQFDDDERFLDEIEFLAEERTPKEVIDGWLLTQYSCDHEESPREQGTILRMNYLKHDWESRDFDALQRGLSRLISPFDPRTDFNLYVDLPEKYGGLATKIEPPELIKYPHYTVAGSVDTFGQYDFTVKLEASGGSHSFTGVFYDKLSDEGWDTLESSVLPENFDSESFRRLECGPLEFELRIWDRDDLENVTQKIGGGIRSVRKDLDAIAGINIYRDGFRVLPYGEPDNDWLRLDLRRVQKPTRHLSNNQITGYIAISADANPKLHDRSNREGLDNNAAYQDLQGVMLSILSDLEKLRWREKRNKSDNSEVAGVKSKPLFEEPDLSELKNSVKDEKADPEQTLRLISKAEADWNSQLKKLKEVLSQYHALASLGGLVDKVLHEGRQPLASIQTEAGLGHELSSSLVEAVSPEHTKKLEEIDGGFQRIVRQATTLRDVFRRIEPFGGRKRGRPKKHYLEDLIKETFEIYSQDLKSKRIEVDIPDTQTLVSVDYSEMTEVFSNLLSNSIYWLDFVPKEKRKISVVIDRHRENELEIIFADTGPGVEPKNRNYIFDPYFSGRPEGHGLGLSMVGEIIHGYYNGSIELVDSGRNGGAVFRIVIRKRV